MPTIEKHAEISMKQTGKFYRNVYQWIDDSQNKDERHVP